MTRNVGDIALAERAAANRCHGTLDFDAELIATMGLDPGLTVLDVACGDGRHACAYKRIVESGRVCGIDQSASLIAKAKERAQRAGLEVDFRLGDALALHYEDGLFDRVSCNYALYHFPDMRKALDEMGRVARSGGKIVLTGPAPDNNAELYRCHEAAGGGHGAGMGRYRFENEVRAWLTDRAPRHAHRTLDNPVTFPSTEDCLAYYKGTKLFLDNVPEAERERFLDGVARVLDDDGITRPTVSKKIAVFEIWI
jgi:SAM-dependent methyltransferase